MTNYAKDLHRKGELAKVDEMERMATKLIRGKDMGSAFLTEAYLGADCFAIIPNKPEFSKYGGYVVYDEDANKPVFVADEEGEA